MPTGRFRSRYTCFITAMFETALSLLIYFWEPTQITSPIETLRADKLEEKSTADLS